MIKHSYKCKDCQNKWTIFVPQDLVPSECPIETCKSLNIVKDFNFKIKTDEVVDETGILTINFLEENENILKEMKKEEMKWK